MEETVEEIMEFIMKKVETLSRDEFQDVLLEVVSSIDDHLTALANDDENFSENFDNED